MYIIKDSNDTKYSYHKIYVVFNLYIAMMYNLIYVKVFQGVFVLQVNMCNMIAYCNIFRVLYGGVEQI